MQHTTQQEPKYRVGMRLGYIPEACGTRYANGGWTVSWASELGAKLLDAGIYYVNCHGIACGLDWLPSRDSRR